MGSALLLLVLEGSGASAQAAPAAETVILLQPSTASLAARRSLARIRDELSADRFDVIVADSNTAGDPGAVIEDAAARLAEAGTVIVMFGDPESGQAELCVVRRTTRRTAVRRATVTVDDPERIPELLAKRALELLRATALELSLEIEPPPRAEKLVEPRPQPGMPSSSIPPAPTPGSAIVVVDMGVGMWTSVDGPPPAWAPVGRVGLHLYEWAWARVSIAGFGSRPRVDTTYGSAWLSQTMALLECAAIFRHDKRVRPTVSLGAGALEVEIVGTGAAPYEGRETQRWSAALDGGVGVAFAVGSHAAVATELHALLASPHPVIHFVDMRAGTVGYPSLILTLALRVAP